MDQNINKIFFQKKTIAYAVRGDVLSFMNQTAISLHTRIPHTTGKCEAHLTTQILLFSMIPLPCQLVYATNHTDYR